MNREENFFNFSFYLKKKRRAFFNFLEKRWDSLLISLLNGHPGNFFEDEKKLRSINRDFEKKISNEDELYSMKKKFNETV